MKLNTCGGWSQGTGGDFISVRTVEHHRSNICSKGSIARSRTIAMPARTSAPKSLETKRKKNSTVKPLLFLRMEQH
jgi:hypothetical protein